MSSTPIADHAMLSDRHTSALVDSAGSVEWLCLPRFDSPAVFGRLLDPAAGHWSIRPAAASRASRRYREDSLALDSVFNAPTGVLVVTDLLGLGRDNGGHRLGTDVPHLLIRCVECVEGTVEVEVDYRPRPHYASRPTTSLPMAGGVWSPLEHGALVLSSPLPLEVARDGATGRATLRSLDKVLFALQHIEGPEVRPRVWSQPQLTEKVEQSIDAWRSAGTSSTSSTPR